MPRESGTFDHSTADLEIIIGVSIKWGATQFRRIKGSVCGSVSNPVGPSVPVLLVVHQVCLVLRPV